VQLRFVVEHVVEVNPESAVEFEDGEGSIGGTGLLRRRDRREKGEGEEQKKIWSGCRAHEESHDSSANFSHAQTRDSFFPLFCNTRCNMPAYFAVGRIG
jgi:hypothetical protein